MITPADLVRAVAREPLAPRQQDMLDTIKRLTAAHGFPPTIRELGEAMGIKSSNGVNDHLKALERKGYIKRDALKSRAIVVVG